MAESGLEIRIDSKDFQRKLSEASPNFNRLVKQGLHNTGEMLRQTSSALAPHDKGDLARSIDFKLGDSSVKVGTDKVYARIQEFGGIIKVKKAKFLRFFWKKKGVWVQTKSVRIMAQPYLRPALSQNAIRIGKIFTDLLKRV